MSEVSIFLFRVGPCVDVIFTHLYLMELYFGGIHLIVKKYLKFRKE